MRVGLLWLGCNWATTYIDGHTSSCSRQHTPWRPTGAAWPTASPAQLPPARPPHAGRPPRAQHGPLPCFQPATEVNTRIEMVLKSWTWCVQVHTLDPSVIGQRRRWMKRRRYPHLGTRALPPCLHLLQLSTPHPQRLLAHSHRLARCLHPSGCVLGLQPQGCQLRLHGNRGLGGFQGLASGQPPLLHDHHMWHTR